MLIRVKTKNFRALGSFEHAFRGGITGCVGEMGTGKSTLGYAALFGLTGLTPTSIKRKNLLSWGAKKGFVEVDLLIGGKMLKVVRFFPGSKASLVFGSDEVSGTSKVNAMIENIYACSLENIFKTSLIQQGKLTECINVSSTERQKLYARLVPGLKRADQAIDSLSMFARSDLQVYKSRVEEKNELKSNNRLIAEAIGDYKKTAGEMEVAVKLAEGERDELRAQVLKPGSIVKSKLDEALALNNKALVDTSDYVCKAEKEADGLRDAIRSLKTVDLPVNINAILEAKNSVGRHKDNIPRLKEQVNIEDPIVTSEFSKADEKINALRAEYAELSNRYTAVFADCQEMIKAIKHMEEGKCPTCGSEYDCSNLEATREKLDKSNKILLELKEKTEEIRKEGSELKASKEAEESANAHAISEHARLVAAANANLEMELKLISDAEAIIIEPWKSKTVEEIQELIVAEKNKKANESLLSSLDGQIEVANGSIASIKDNIKKYNAMEVIPDDILNAFKESDDVYTSLNKELSAVLANIASSEAMFAQNKEVIDRIEKQEYEDRITNAFNTKLEKAIFLLGRRNLPLKALKYYLDAVNANVARLLLDFGARFTFRLNDEFDIEVQFGDIIDGACALSGGQAAMCAVALKMTEIQVFGGNAGFVVADEIGYGLSQGEGFNGLVDVLNKFKEGIGKGMQMLLATHEQALVPTFNHKIEF